jgi:hypothetical protein
MAPRLLGILLMALLFSFGCSTTRSLTLASTRNVDLSAPHEVISRGASRTDGRFWLLFIPFGGEPDGIGALSDLLEKEEGDYLTNVEVTATGWSLLAVSWGSVSVKGDVLRAVERPAAPVPAPAAMPAPSAMPEAAGQAMPGDEDAVE